MALTHPDQKPDEWIVAITRNPAMYALGNTGRVLLTAYDDKGSPLPGVCTVLMSSWEMKKYELKPVNEVPKVIRDSNYSKPLLYPVSSPADEKDKSSVIKFPDIPTGSVQRRNQG